MYPIFRDLRQFLHIVTLTSEVLPPNLQLYTPSFVFTCIFYKVFGRYLLCCVRIGLDWIQLLGHQLDWTGLGSVTRGFGLDWIASTQSISYSVQNTPKVTLSVQNVMVHESDTVKNLGLVMDRSLDYDEHVKSVCSKCVGILIGLARVRRCVPNAFFPSSYRVSCSR